MNKIKKYFETAGGISLLKLWLKAGVLLDAILLFFLLGHTKKGLEQLRNAVELKIQNKLRKKFRKEIAGLHHQTKDSPSIQPTNKTIWIFWWQGIEDAPEIVKICYQSVVEHMKEWKVILLTENNYKHYTNIPDFIMEKVSKGTITLTHFSDILRLDLLIRRGGLWLDATVLCTNGDIPHVIIQSSLFVYQTQKPGADGHASLLSSWCMWAKRENHILKATQSLLYTYWRRYNFMTDYFLLHQFMTIVMQEFPEEAKLIPPYTNENPHILLLHLFDKFDKELWADWKIQACFHKLSYKLSEENMKKNGTFYHFIINKGK